MKSTKKYTYSLPTSLVEEIKRIFPKDTLMSRNDRKRAFRFFHTLTTKSQLQNGTPDGYVEISSNYLRKMYSGNYLRFLELLRKNGLIEGYETDTSKDSYTTARATNELTKINGKERKPRSKKIRLCQKFTFIFSYNYYNNNIINNNKQNNSNRDFKLLPTFSESMLTKVTYEYGAKSKEQLDIEFEKDFSRMVSFLNIDYQKLFEKAKELSENTDVRKYIVNEYEDMDNVVPITVVTWGSSVPMYLNSAKRLADNRHETLFKVKGRYFMAGIEQFSERLKTSRYLSYINSIDRLCFGDITAKRNTVNKRLDTNFTNMKSELFDIICKDNGLVQIDLSNSQFTILANYLKNTKKFDTDDFRIFYNDAVSGNLYENISERIGISREDAKMLMFQIMFNKTGARIKHKELLYETYPSVMEYIDSFKKHNGYKKFSVYLQKLESNIFIDGLYPLIKNNIGLVFTKHDSVICRENDIEKVRNIIKDYFLSINFKGELKIS